MSEMQFLAGNNAIRIVTVVALAVVAIIVITQRRVVEGRQWHPEKLAVVAIAIIGAFVMVAYVVTEGRHRDAAGGTQVTEEQRARKLQQVQYNEQMESADTRQKLYFNSASPVIRQSAPQPVSTNPQ